MFAQCRKQWPNIKSTLAQHLVLIVTEVHGIHSQTTFHCEFWRIIFLKLHSKCAVDRQTNEQVDDI